MTLCKEERKINEKIQIIRGKNKRVKTEKENMEIKEEMKMVRRRMDQMKKEKREAEK